MRPRAPFTGSDVPKSSQQRGGGKYGTTLLERPPSQEEVSEARSSLRLLKSKMKTRDTNQGNFDEEGGLDDRHNFRKKEPEINTRTNAQYRKVFKPTTSQERPQSQEYDEVETNEYSLNKKSTISQNTNSRIGGDESYSNSNTRRPPLSSTKQNATGNKFGGIPRSDNKSNAFSNENEDNFPSRISKNTLNRDPSPSNGFSSKKGPTKGGFSQSDQKYGSQGLSMPSLQDTDFQDQPYGGANKGYASGGIKKNSFGERNQLNDGGFNRGKGSMMNKFNDADEDPVETRNAKVFSKPNLKKGPIKQWDDSPPEDTYEPPKNLKPKGMSKPANKKDNYQTNQHNQHNDAYQAQIQKSVNPLEEIPLSKLKGNAQISDEPLDEGELIECPEGCGRSFREDVLQKHVKVCKKVFQSKRKQFDSAAARKTEEQLQLETKPVKKTAPQPSKQGAKKPQAVSGQPKWKAQSEAFRAGLRAARGEKLNHQEQAALNIQSQIDLIPCEHCGRKFNEKAAERHIPFCASKSKLDSVKYGGGKPIGGGRGTSRKY